MDRPEQAAAADDRLQQLRRQLRRRPNDGKAWLELARRLAGGPPGPELHHAIEQAIRSLPEEEAPWRLAALLHQRRGGAPAALRWLENAAGDNPALQAPRRVLAALRGDELRRRGRWRAALEQYVLAASTRPDDPVLLNNMASCQASLGEYEDAERHLLRALERMPDFAEARLNLGLLRACQQRDTEALTQIDAALRQEGLPGPTREAARSLRALLLEQQRLAPAIAGALDEGGVESLQHALDSAPPGLKEPHAETVEKLRTLAERCVDLAASGPPRGLPAFDIRSQLLEAFAHCKLPGGPESLARLWEALREPASAGAEAQALERVLRVVRARGAREISELSGDRGEAWLKHWHARLLEPETPARPGQYKLTDNLVYGWPTAPAKQVAGTLRVLLHELAPRVPAGWMRGLYLYSAINIVHGFGDGNGRLARFLLAWSTESVGAGTLILPLGLREAAARALIDLRRGLDPGPHEALLREALEQSGRDFEHLQALGVGTRNHPLLPAGPLV